MKCIQMRIVNYKFSEMRTQRHMLNMFTYCGSQGFAHTDLQPCISYAFIKVCHAHVLAA